MRLIDAPVEERTLKGHDGTPLGVYVAGRGPGRMVLAPGLGTNVYCWKYFFEHFQDSYTMVTWDPRGTYRSGIPGNEGNLHLADHVMDLAALRDALGWPSFVLGGWSMGVQISLEYYHRFPDDARALLLINGAFEHVLGTAFSLPGADLLFPGLLCLGGTLHPVMAPLVSRLFEAHWVVDVIQAVGLLANNKEHFRHIVLEFSRMDWRVYAKLMLFLNEHSARPYFGEVRVPTLITAGTKDFMTPVSTAEEMHRGIAGSVLRVIEGGTHYTMVEFPDELHRAVEEVLGTVTSRNPGRS